MAILKNKLNNLLKTNIDLGLYHFYKNYISDALFRFKLIYTFKKSELKVLYNLGRCFYAKGEKTKAEKFFTKASVLSKTQYKEEIKFYLQKIKNKKKIKSIPIEMLREKFDFLAHYYVEDIIVKNNYEGHIHILDCIQHNVEAARLPNMQILDIGCGTGICSHLLKANKIGKHIHGVDISTNMLKIANFCLIKKQPIFDKIFNANIENFLLNTSNSYDLMIAANSINYIGKLDTLFSLCNSRLLENGVFIFTININDNMKTGFEILEKYNSFCYSYEYVEKVIEKNNFEIKNNYELEMFQGTHSRLFIASKK